MNINQILRKILKEATSDSSGSRGSYVAPLEPGVREFKKIDLQPFTIPVSKYNDAMLEYDSYDGSMSLPKKQINKIEKKAKKISNYIKNHPNTTFSDDDGNNINQTPGKNLKMVPIKEDLSVWFGDKKKSKDSSQPQGPWVNICRNKKGGGHPPCGRPDADSKGYPKCRAAGVAAKMTDEQKKSACQQKRNAEKKDTQTGKGQKPIMTSYKPRTNENMKRKIITLNENDLMRIVKRVLKEQRDEPVVSENQDISLSCQGYAFYMDNGIEKIKLSSKYDVSGKLSTSTQVIQGSSFTDTGHKINDPYGTGFEREYSEKVGLRFSVILNTPSMDAFAPESGYNDETFILRPLNKTTRALLGISSDKNVIINMDRGRELGFCKITSNTPSEEFKNELVSNWDLDNNVF